MGGRVWSDFADDFPWQCDAYSLLNEAARVYYLPAFLLAAIGPQCGTQNVSIESALGDGRLDPKDFTAAQRFVICQWAKSCWTSTANLPLETVLATWTSER
jgi:hypothetical protein